MKKRMLALLLTLCMVVSLLPMQVFAEGEADWAINGLATEQTVGDPATATVVIVDSTEAITEAITWSSSDTSVATVEDTTATSAVVTFVGPGDVTITAKGSQTATWDVKVKAAEAPAPTTANVTIKGNSLSFKLTKDGTTSEYTETTVDVAVGSTLRKDGYAFAWVDGSSFLSWSVNGVGQDANMDLLDYEITADTTFEAGVVGVGGGDGDSGNTTPANTIAFNGNGGDFTVTMNPDNIWDTNYYAYTVADGQPMSSHATISDPWKTDYEFTGWLQGEQNENGDFTQDEGTSLMTTTAALAVPAVEGKLITFMAQWKEATPGVDGGDGDGGDGDTGNANLEAFNIGETKIVAPDGEDVRFTFTPEEDGRYAVYHTNDQGRDYGISRKAFVAGGEELTANDWMAWTGYTDIVLGTTWTMTANTAYELVFSGYNTCDFTLVKVVAPTAVHVIGDRVSGYVGKTGWVEPYFTPVYAETGAEFTYKVADESIAKFANGELQFLKAGNTTMTVTCGDLSTTVDVRSLDYRPLTLGEMDVANTEDIGHIFYTFTTEEAGDYTFEASGDKFFLLWGEKAGSDEQAIEVRVEEGDPTVQVISLEANTTYTMQAAVEEYNKAVHVKVTKGDTTSGDEGGDQGGNVPTIEFHANGGEFTVTTANDSWPTNGFGEIVPVGETMGDYATISDPWRDGWTFDGWALCEWGPTYDEEGNQVGEDYIQVEGTGLFTTEKALAEKYQGTKLIFLAQWSGGSEGGNEGGEANVEINANHGEVLLHGANETRGAHDINVEPGKSMAEVGEKVDDPIYWDGARKFSGWIVETWEEVSDEEGNTYWDYVVVPGTGVMTTAEMLNYKTPADGTKIRFFAQWEGDDSEYFSDVGFETLDGILTMTHPDDSTEQTTAPGERCKEDGSKISQQIEWTISEPVHPEFTFEGWLVFEDGIMNMVSETIYTTEQVFDMTVPSYNVRFVAKWSGIPLEDYKTMFQQGDEGGDDENSHPGIHLDADGGMVTITCDGVVQEQDAPYISVGVPGGKSLADMGFQVSLKYWTQQRAFEGWKATTVEERVDENGEIYNELIQIPGTSLMTTAEILEYPALTEKQIIFVAQWAGEDDNYYNWVSFNPVGGQVEIGNENWGNMFEGYETNFKLNGKTFAEAADDYPLSDPVHPDYKFEGWLEIYGQDGRLVSETLLTTDQLLAKKVTTYDVLFAAKWDGIPMEEYKTMFQQGDEGGEGEVGEPIIPEDATVTAVVLDKKYSLPSQQDAYFTYTAAAEGWYAIKSDMATRDLFVRMANTAEGTYNEEYLSADYALVFYLAKGAEIEFSANGYFSSNMWVEKLNSVKKLEIASQDTTTEYLNSENLMPFHTLKDVDFKVTLADGTTQVVDGAKVMDTGAILGMPIYMELFEVENNPNVYGVRVYCCDGNVEYKINLTKAKPVKLEASINLPFDIYEGAYCRMAKDENGQYFMYYNIEDVVQWRADYKLTMSDGTVETFNLPMNGQAQYKGINMDFNFDNQYEKHWDIGKNYTYAYYGDLVAKIEVEVKENPIKSTELLSFGVNKYTLGDTDYFYKTSEGQMMIWADFSDFELKVTYKDGTSKILTEEDITLYKDVLPLLGNQPYTEVVEEKVHTGAGKNYVGIEYMGLLASTQVDVITETAVNGSNASVPESVVDKALEEAVKENAKKPVVTLDVKADKEQAASGNITSSVKLPVASVEKLVEEKVQTVVVELDTVTVEMDWKALAAIADQAEGSVTLVVEEIEPETLTEKQQAAIEDKKVAAIISAELICSVTQKPIATEDADGFDGGKVTVKIPFEPEEGFKGKDYVVIYVADDGSMKEIKTKYKKGCLVVELEHFSDYVIVNKAADGTKDEGADKDTGKDSDKGSSNSGTAAPDTGDHSNMLGMTTLMLASAMLLAVAAWMFFSKKRRA